MQRDGRMDGRTVVWRALAEPDSLLLLLPPASSPTVLHRPPHSTHPNCAATRLLYLWLRPLMWKKLSSGPVDLEIEYRLRSARDGPPSSGDLGPRPRVREQSVPCRSAGVGGVGRIFYLHFQSGGRRRCGEDGDPRAARSVC